MRLSINKAEGAGGAAGALLDRLAASGLRVTGPRTVVIGQIAERRSSFTAGELVESVANCAPEVGRATVFRTLDLLVEHGILRRVHTDTGATWGHSYVLCGLSDAHHHHLICTRCGDVSDFEGCSVSSMVSGLQERTGFRVEGHHLELYGECRRCQGGE